MKIFKIVSVFIFLLLSSCSTDKTTGIMKQSIVVPYAEGKSFPAATYYRQSVDKVPAIILAFQQNPGESVLDDFAKEIANSGYFVIAMQAAQTRSSISVQDSFCVRALAAVVQVAKSSSSVKSNKIGLWGTGSFGITALHVAALDSNVAAVVTVGSAKYFSKVQQKDLQKIPPRPVLIIESTLTPRHPENKKARYFDSAKQPKKPVWLATSTEGAPVLASDMEPIVRRTTLMLIDRYLKGK